MPIVAVGGSGIDLDIFLRNGAGALTDPASIFYDIKEPAGSLVADDVAPFKRSVGHYDARTTIIPSGFSITEPWTIIWSWTSAGGVTGSKTEEFTVSSSIEGSFTDIDEIIEQIQEDIALTDTELTDEQITLFISKSLDRLNIKLKLQGTDGELSIDESTGAIVPTPNSSMRALIVMQAECLIVKRKQAGAVSNGIRVRDGDSEIDTTAGFRGLGDVVNNVCNELKDAINDYLSGIDGVGNHGDLIWHGNQRIIEDEDHDGQAFRQRDYRSPFDDDCGHLYTGRCEC